jgi:hypothetical protein
MQNRYYLYQRRDSGIHFIQDRLTSKHTSLRTRDPVIAKRLFHARNEAAEQPMLNVSMAKVYLSATAPEMVTRTWLEVMQAMEKTYHEETLIRWRKMIRCAPFASLLNVALVYTNSTHFLAVLHHPRAGTSTNKWLRIVHNRALDLGWLLSPVLARKAWPPIRTKRMKALTQVQHEKLVATEFDAEFRYYLQMLWETGGSQTDVARLHRDNVDLERWVVTYSRKKLEGRGQGHAAIAIGVPLEQLLKNLPTEGFLFPKLVTQNDKVRASRFRKRADRLGFTNISLHSYRYAWAQRAKIAGMPLREAMAHLGHGSKAIHYAYSEKAEIVTLPLDYYEGVRQKKIIEFARTAAA